MDKQTIIRNMERQFGRRGCITKTEFAEYMGISRHHLGDWLDGLDKINGKYYFIPDVAQRLMDRRVTG